MATTTTTTTSGSLVRLSVLRSALQAVAAQRSHAAGHAAVQEALDLLVAAAAGATLPSATVPEVEHAVAEAVTAHMPWTHATALDHVLISFLLLHPQYCRVLLRALMARMQHGPTSTAAPATPAAPTTGPAAPAAAPAAPAAAPGAKATVAHGSSSMAAAAPAAAAAATAAATAPPAQAPVAAAGTATAQPAGPGVAAPHKPCGKKHWPMCLLIVCFRGVGSAEPGSHAPRAPMWPNAFTRLATSLLCEMAALYQDHLHLAQQQQQQKASSTSASSTPTAHPQGHSLTRPIHHIHPSSLIKLVVDCLLEVPSSEARHLLLADAIQTSARHVGHMTASHVTASSDYGGSSVAHAGHDLALTGDGKRQHEEEEEEEGKRGAKRMRLNEGPDLPSHAPTFQPSMQPPMQPSTQPSMQPSTQAGADMSAHGGAGAHAASTWGLFLAHACHDDLLRYGAPTLATNLLWLIITHPSLFNDQDLAASSQLLTKALQTLTPLQLQQWVRDAACSGSVQALPNQPIITPNSRQHTAGVPRTGLCRLLSILSSADTLRHAFPPPGSFTTATTTIASPPPRLPPLPAAAQPPTLPYPTPQQPALQQYQAQHPPSVGLDSDSDMDMNADDVSGDDDGGVGEGQGEEGEEQEGHGMEPELLARDIPGKPRSQAAAGTPLAAAASHSMGLGSGGNQTTKNMQAAGKASKPAGKGAKGPKQQAKRPAAAPVGLESSTGVQLVRQVSPPLQPAWLVGLLPWLLGMMAGREGMGEVVAARGAAVLLGELLSSGLLLPCQPATTVTLAARALAAWAKTAADLQVGMLASAWCEALGVPCDLWHCLGSCDEAPSFKALAAQASRPQCGNGLSWQRVSSLLCVCNHVAPQSPLYRLALACFLVLVSQQATPCGPGQSEILPTQAPAIVPSQAPRAASGSDDVPHEEVGQVVQWIRGAILGVVPSSVASAGGATSVGGATAQATAGGHVAPAVAAPQAFSYLEPCRADMLRVCLLVGVGGPAEAGGGQLAAPLTGQARPIEGGDGERACTTLASAVLQALQPEMRQAAEATRAPGAPALGASARRVILRVCGAGVGTQGATAVQGVGATGQTDSCLHHALVQAAQLLARGALGGT